MATRLNSDDLRLLNRVQLLGRRGLTEAEIAARLGLHEEQLRERMNRIRSAFASLDHVSAQVRGESAAERSGWWEIVIQEPQEPVACGDATPETTGC